MYVIVEPLMRQGVWEQNSHKWGMCKGVLTHGCYAGHVMYDQSDVWVPNIGCIALAYVQWPVCCVCDAAFTKKSDIQGCLT